MTNTAKSIRKALTSAFVLIMMMATIFVMPVQADASSMSGTEKECIYTGRVGAQVTFETGNKNDTIIVSPINGKYVYATIRNKKQTTTFKGCYDAYLLDDCGNILEKKSNYSSAGHGVRYSNKNITFDVKANEMYVIRIEYRYDMTRDCIDKPVFLGFNGSPTITDEPGVKLTGKKKNWCGTPLITFYDGLYE